jgi:hypothetical protein
MEAIQTITDGVIRILNPQDEYALDTNKLRELSPEKREMLLEKTGYSAIESLIYDISKLN